MLQCIEVIKGCTSSLMGCSVLQCVAVCCSDSRLHWKSYGVYMKLQSVAVCCSVVQCVSVIWGCSGSLMGGTCDEFQCVAVSCSVLQSVAKCRSVLQ